MLLSVDNIIANPELYRNHYNDYSPHNAYYNYYDEYRKHAHSYEHDYEEKRAIELEKEKQEREEYIRTHKKISLEELDAQIRQAWDEAKATDKRPSREMIFSTEIVDRDKYVEAYRKEKEAQKLNNLMNPLTRAEEEALREKERQTPRNIKLSSYDFMHYDYSGQNGNVVYWIEGVRFSKDEYEECSSIIQQARSLLPSGSLDYMDHALLGLAYNVVDTYARENLTWDQREVLSQSVAANFGTRILWDQEGFIKRGVMVNPSDKFHNIREKNGAINVSATNEELVQSLWGMFGGVDLRDQKAVNKVFGQYLSIAGIAGSFREDSILKVKLSNAQAILKGVGKKVDYSI